MRRDVSNSMPIIAADVSRSACGIVIVGFQGTYNLVTMVETVTAPTLSERIGEVRGRIEACALRGNRAPNEITLVAVSKPHPAEVIREAIAAGVTELGENRVQEAEGKIPNVGRHAARWHLIGHLQSNKARRAVELFDVIHSLDSVALARRLDRVCGEINRAELPVLIQIDLGQEATKTGAPEKAVPEIIDALKNSTRLRLAGLMTLPPYFEDPEKTRPFFRR